MKSLFTKLADELRVVSQGRSPEVSDALMKIGVSFAIFVVFAAFVAILYWFGYYSVKVNFAAGIGACLVLLYVPYQVFRLAFVLPRYRMTVLFSINLVILLAIVGTYGYALYWVIDWLKYSHR